MLNDLSTEGLVFLQAHLGGDRNFTYLLGDPDAGVAAVVDPGFDASGIRRLASERNLAIGKILITHGHGDHTGAVGELAAITGAAIHAGSSSSVEGALAVSDGDRIDLGGLAVEALVTPGHAPDHVCWLCGDRLLTGDLLFCGKVGGTGDFFPGSSARSEWDSLHRLLVLPDETRVFPGHDYYGGEGEMPHSTIGHERRSNPFLTCADFEAFIDLKENWAEYKARHGIR